MEALLLNLKHALWMFREGGVSFVVTAVVALGLGLGANTAILSLVNAVLLKPSPFPKARRLVFFETKYPEGEDRGASPTNFAHWARQTSVVEDAAAFTGGVMNWTNGPFPQQVQTERVSSKCFPLFGVLMILGRGFNAQEDTPGAEQTVVISEGLRRDLSSTMKEPASRSGSGAADAYSRGNYSVKPGFETKG